MNIEENMKRTFFAVFGVATLLRPAALWAQAEPPKEESATLQVPLVEKATLGGQVRIRGEYKDPADYRLPGANGRSAAEDVRDSDEFASLRVRLNLDLDVAKDVKTFVQIRDSRTFGEEGYVLTDLESTDLHQGWVRGSNLLGVPLSVTAGRIEVPNLGDGRLVSCSDWNNVGRSWDGVAAVFAPQDFWLYGSYAVIREDTGTNGRDQYFGALYASYRGIEKHEFDACLFSRDFRDDPVTGEEGRNGDIADFTAGLRVKGEASGFDYAAEAAVQTGDYATDRVGADFVALKAGYTFDIDWKPRVGIEVARASGDDDPSDGDRRTFDPLLPSTHPFHGVADLVILKNVRTLMLTTRVQPAEGVTVMLDGHLFRLDEEVDAWYGTSTTSVQGATTRRDSSGAAGDRLGSEVDLQAKWKVREQVELFSGYAVFLPGTYVEDTGPSPNGQWFFVQVLVGF